MPILQDPRTMLGANFDEAMQYSLVPVFRVPSRQGAGWKPVGEVMNNDGELMQMIARKKSRQLLEQEAKQSGLQAAQENRNKPRPNPPAKWAPSPWALEWEKSKRNKLRKRGLLGGEMEGVEVLVQPKVEVPVQPEVEASVKVRVGSTRKRVSDSSRDSDAPRKSRTRRRPRKDGGADRQAPLVPVLPKGDDS